MPRGWSRAGFALDALVLTALVWAVRQVPLTVVIVGGGIVLIAGVALLMLSWVGAPMAAFTPVERLRLLHLRAKVRFARVRYWRLHHH